MAHPRATPAPRRNPDFSRGLLWALEHGPPPQHPLQGLLSLCPDKSDQPHSTGKCILSSRLIILFPAHLHGQGHSVPPLMVSIQGKTFPGWKHVFACFNLLAVTQPDLRLSSKALWHLVCQLKHPLQEIYEFMDVSAFFWSLHLFFSHCFEISLL